VIERKKNFGTYFIDESGMFSVDGTSNGQFVQKS